MSPIRAAAALVLPFAAALAGVLAPADPARAQAAGAADLAKKLSNPVASLISVPIQTNYDQGFGPATAKKGGQVGNGEGSRKPTFGAPSKRQGPQFRRLRLPPQRVLPKQLRQLGVPPKASIAPSELRCHSYFFMATS